MIVYIMRGIPGSGKSVWVRQQAMVYSAEGKICHVICADDYHTANGRYEYKPENARYANDDCYRRFVIHMLSANEMSAIFVDNTNITLWELAPYYRLAEMYAKEVTIVEMDCPFWLACKRNYINHDVPASIMRDMHQNLQQERLPRHYKRQFVFKEVE